MSNTIMGRLETRRLRTIQNISDNLHFSGEEWRGVQGDTTITIRDHLENGSLASRRIFLARKVAGCAMSSEVVIVPGKSEYSLPAVRAVHYNGPDIDGGDRPVRYDSVQRDTNSYAFGFPTGIAQAVDTVRRAQELYVQMESAPLSTADS